VRAIDTNIVVRYLTLDDGTQAKAARSTLEKTGDIFISLTACLETDGCCGMHICIQQTGSRRGYRSSGACPAFPSGNPWPSQQRLNGCERAWILPMRCILAMAEGCTAFTSFDKNLAKAAEGRSSIPVQTP